MTTISDERLAEMLAEVEIEQENAVADAEADQNPQLAVDAVGEFALSEVSSILTELQSLRAQGGVRVKPLEWHRSEIIGWNGDWHTVPTAYSIRCADENGWKWSGFGGFGYERSDEAAKAAAKADYERRILSSLEASPAPVSEHPDDLAVDRFAAAMKAKLAKKREEGRGGWESKDECSAEFLSQLLREHVEKGDPLDVGNLAMMLHQRGDAISPASVSEECATDGCFTPATVHFERGGVGSKYCHSCYLKVQSLAAKGGQ